MLWSNSRGTVPARNLAISVPRNWISRVSSGRRFSTVAVIWSVDKPVSMLCTDPTVDSACEAISERGIGVGAGLGFDTAGDNCCAPAIGPLKPQQNAMNKPMRICRCKVNDPGSSSASAVLSAWVRGICIRLALYVSGIYCEIEVTLIWQRVDGKRRKDSGGSSTSLFLFEK